MALCTISGKLVDASETAISGVVIKASIVTPNANSSATQFILPKEVSTTSAADGTWSLTLSQLLSVILALEYPPNNTDSARRVTYAGTVPATSTASFNTVFTEL